MRTLSGSTPSPAVASRIEDITIAATSTTHCLRKAFERAVRNSGLSVKDQEFFMGHILPGSQDAYYDYTKVEELRRKYMQIKFFPYLTADIEELRKRQILDMVRLLGFPEDRIKRVEEALAKYKTVDDAIEEIRKLSLEDYKVKEERDPRLHLNLSIAF